ncbi:carboxypeptidase-like regulatory domain-containing protein [Myxosarcina sp. GI1]|uniref:carboxypeptidase-like regulatory domain-containing protein n=1 Tax=Myxosarcina sp. GI1 TaxID=1541065 RepID=UPI00056020FD|nr:carboxypeptidase-like regulatory domain-containing protein [Myxosarcina sp. GI1]
MNKWYFLISLFLLSLSPKPVLAHGAQIEYRETSAITIRATYDDGTPMANAQVVIYAPNEPATPWLKGMTDSEGNFTFVPDRKNTGEWDVKVRQSGHGDITSIPIADKTSSANVSQTQMSANQSSEGNYTSAQKLVMAVVGVWGFIGTALFFSRKNTQN